MTAAARLEDTDPPKRIAPVKQTNRNYKASRVKLEEERAEERRIRQIALQERRDMLADLLPITRLSVVSADLEDGERPSDFMQTARAICEHCGYRTTGGNHELCDEKAHRG